MSTVSASRFPTVTAWMTAALFLSSCGGGAQNPQSSVLPNNRDAAGLAASTGYQVIYPFSGGLDGGNAATQLVFDTSGNAYGTTVQGGSADCGTVFKLHPASGGHWQESVLYNFSCFADGKNPHGGVIRDTHGNLYGTTTAGGLNGGCTGDGCGVVYEVKPGGTQTVLHTFQGKDDGFGPGSPLTFDAQGNLYGMAPDGGKFASGTVFTLQPSGTSWHFAVIHPFAGGNGGATGSLGALFVDAHGALLGVTEIDGAHNAGLAFRMKHVSGTTWMFQPVYAFKGTPDAAFPYGGLIESGGKLYGTTYYGGAHGNGSVFELTFGSNTFAERVVYSFKGGTDGSSPTSTLLAASDGSLYGTTSAGGNSGCGCGTVFKLSAGTFAESVLHRFGGSHDGQNPYYGLTQSGPLLYSSTVAGGTSGSGTIFSIAP